MTVLLALAATASASSHREAPVISRDPAADLSDFYAFVNPTNPNYVVFILNVNPLSDPGGGPNFHHFDDSVRYYIHCDNEGDGVEDISYRFQTTTTYQYPDEFLYNLGDVSNAANVNIQQTYTVLRIDDDLPTTHWVIPPTAPARVAPINVGVMSGGGYTPNSSAVSAATASYVNTVGAGVQQHKVFGGPRQEGFYVDLERTFDLLNLGGAGNTNTLKGKNVSTFAVQVHKNLLTKDLAAPSVAAGNNVIACWAASARQQNSAIDPTDGTPTYSGAYMPMARLGNPLVNEVVIPIGMKDFFNVSHPVDDAANFLSYVTDPILPVYMEAILGVPNPVSYNAGLGIGGREDLVLAFLTGDPGLGTQPVGFSLGGPIPGEPGKVFAGFEALRLNLADPTSSWPNGRLVTDDVTDTALSAMAGLLIPGNGSVVPDGVDASGLHFLNGFPYLGDPWPGDDHPAGYHDLP